eukprot:UN1540
MNEECDDVKVQYGFSLKIVEDFIPEEDGILRHYIATAMLSWRSFSWQKLTDTITGLSTKKQFATGEGSAENWGYFHTTMVPAIRRIYEAGNWTEYIQEVEVPCLNASGLLEKAGLRAADIIMLTIDAEGYDIPIMKSFIGSPDFSPTLVRWEGSLEDFTAGAVLRFFQSQGYFVGRSQQSHSRDVLAYKGPSV